MSNPRAAIREALKTILKGPAEGPAPTGAGQKVYSSRSTPIGPKRLPALLIYTRDERRDDSYRHDAIIRRLLDVYVELAAVGPDADDVVDLIATQVEQVVAADPTLGGAVDAAEWQATETEYDGDGGEPLAGGRVRFEVAYYTVPPEAPEPPVPSEVYLGISPKIGPPHEADYIQIAEVPDGTQEP